MTTLFAIPAFMGQASDWHGFKFDCEVDTSPFDKFGSWLWGWADRFNDYATNKTDGPRILMGYSLGGRLAMHALVLDHNLWDAAIIISAHPGLNTPAEKHARLLEDEAWARRFQSEPWDSLMHDWNNQNIFAGKPPVFQRKEKDYNRSQLTNFLLGCSLALQENLSERITNVPCPILWIAGEEDPKYASILSSQPRNHLRSTSWIAPGAAHRVPWECKEQFQNKVNGFIRSNIHANSQ